MWTFSVRTAKEILRDPLTLAFGLGFPVILLLLLSAIEANIPVSLFAIQDLAPGITVFGLSFLTLFSATLIARDRESALLQRLYTTPMTGFDFILGYLLPMIPIALGQCLICYLVALLLGLPVTIHILWAILWILPVGLFFIGLGLLCGSLLGVKPVTGLCGALLANLTGWLSGVWFDLDLVGGWFKRLAYVLPFVHGVELERAVLQGSFGDAIPHLPWVLGYGLVTVALSIWAFLWQRNRQ
jgi:ABC-2 type transport system permease protein